MAYKKSSAEDKDIYQTITDKFITALEQGVPPWQKCWAMDLPSNPQSKTVYSGMNRLLLMVEAAEKGYQSNQWLTWNQKEEMGLKLLPKQKMTPITKFGVYIKQKCDDGKERFIELKPDDPRYKDEKVSKRTFLKTFYVFNMAQFQDFAPEQKGDVFRIEAAEEMLAAMVGQAKLDVRYGSNQAYYEAVNDYVHMPHKHYFKTPQDFYATLFHEGAHATMHGSRLNRPEARGNPFGSIGYAKEELRAEIASVFMNSTLGIQFDESHFSNHASYLQSWIKVLKEDKTEIFKAANDAQKIVNYYEARLLDHRKEQENTNQNVIVTKSNIGLATPTAPVQQTALFH